MMKAIRLLQADPGRAWNVDTLATTCATPRRTLERHFRGFIGCSPSGYLRELRLAQAREALLHAPAGARVTDIATQCGFTHLGRFATQYQRRYGEIPSATIARMEPSGDAQLPAARLVSTGLNRPTIAILPLDCCGHDPNRAAELSDAIAAALAPVGWLRIVSPGNAQYYLRGHLREDERGWLRVTIALIDASTGRYCRAGHWDGAGNDMLRLEDRISTGVLGILRDALGYTEIASASCLELGEPSAWDLTMLALPRVHSFEPGMESSALEWLEQAMGLAPDDPLPVAVAAWCHGQRASYYLVPRPGSEREAARRLVKRGAALNGDRTALAQTMFAAACTLTHDLESAAFHAEQAVAMDGSLAWAWGRKGWIHACRGEVNPALESFHIARRLAPADPLNFLCSIGIASACFEAYRYDAAIQWYRRALAEQPRAILVNRFLAPSCVLAGRMDEAEHSLAELVRAFPDLTIEQVRVSLPHTNSYLDRAAEGLERVGMRIS